LIDKLTKFVKRPARIGTNRRKSMRARRIGWVAIALALVGLWAAVGEAKKKPGRSRLRAEVARLRGEVARLETSVRFLNQNAAEPAPPTGGGVCGDPCATDSDEDGIGDCEDVCPCVADHTDGDTDGTPDCADPCPEDATDACIDPCRSDSDGDGTNDCEDPCPYDPSAAADSDNDGTPDCQDPCPDDPANACSDPCAVDQDGDGVPDCRDECPWIGPAEGGGSTAECSPPPQ
jgi:hypothetical protein